jgi:hypothetical protein
LQLVVVKVVEVALVQVVPKDQLAVVEEQLFKVGYLLLLHL